MTSHSPWCASSCYTHSTSKSQCWANEVPTQTKCSIVQQNQSAFLLLVLTFVSLLHVLLVVVLSYSLMCCNFFESWWKLIIDIHSFSTQFSLHQQDQQAAAYNILLPLSFTTFINNQQHKPANTQYSIDQQALHWEHATPSPGILFPSTSNGSSMIVYFSAKWHSPPPFSALLARLLITRINNTY